jgi:hypothetical protein
MPAFEKLKVNSASSTAEFCSDLDMRRPSELINDTQPINFETTVDQNLGVSRKSHRVTGHKPN